MRNKMRLFTMIELLVVISVIMILFSLLLPGLNAAREYSKRALCISNQKQLHYGWQSYDVDNLWIMPIWTQVDRFDASGPGRTGNWPYVMSVYLNMTDLDDSYWAYVPKQYIRSSVMVCPSMNQTKTDWQFLWETHYGMPYYNMGGMNSGSKAAYKKTQQIKRPAEKVVFADSSGNMRLDQNYMFSETAIHVDFRHAVMANMAFSDGHVGRLTKKSAQAYSGSWTLSAFWGWD